MVIEGRGCRSDRIVVDDGAHGEIVYVSDLADVIDAGGPGSNLIG